LVSPGVDIFSNFPDPRVRNLTKKLPKNSSAAPLPVPPPHLNIDTYITFHAFFLMSCKKGWLHFAKCPYSGKIIVRPNKIKLIGLLCL